MKQDIEKMEMPYLLVVTLLSFWTMLLLSASAQDLLGSPSFPAMFVFGDSLLDDGNNNFLRSLARANFSPYGIDFPGGPTGRFTNGKTVIDLLGEMIGLPYLPPFADTIAKGSNISCGVNFASAAAGILEATGRNLGERISFSQQVRNFESTKSQLKTLMDDENLSQHLAKSLTLVNHGSNDYINNYLLPEFYGTSYIFNPKTYADLLIQRYKNHLLALHGLGLRKFLLGGLGPLGCIPNQLSRNFAPPGTCVTYANDIVSMFNVQLKTLVDQLNSEYQGSIFVYANIYVRLTDIINNPNTYGFTVTDRACCGFGRNGGRVSCLPMAIPCTNRDQYVFWDAFHPTQAVYNILADRVFNGPPDDCHPVNVKKMAQM